MEKGPTLSTIFRTLDGLRRIRLPLSTLACTNLSLHSVRAFRVHVFVVLVDLLQFWSTMALMACQAPYVAGVTLSRSSVAGGAPSRRIFASPPSAFFAPEVHASCSRISALNAAPRPGVQRRKPAFVVRGLFGLGVPELAVIAGVAAIIFGPKQLPQLGKKLGESVKSFQQAAKEFETEVRGESEEETAQGEVSEEKEKTETITPTPVATPSGSENKSL